MKKKNWIWIYTIIVIGLFSIISCIKDDPIEENTATVFDIDGNEYKTVKIGTQVWMAENLRTTRYNDGTAIPIITDGKVWAGLTTPAYCWHNNDATTNKGSYGALYNWYAVYTGKLSPKGWHVPTYDEFTTLTNYLGGENLTGGKLKETGTTHWLSPNTRATNETGFSALPGAYRSSDGAYGSIGYYGYLWSATEYSGSDAYNLDMSCISASIVRYYSDKRQGFSVRCIRD